MIIHSTATREDKNMTTSDKNIPTAKNREEAIRIARANPGQRVRWVLASGHTVEGFSAAWRKGVNDMIWRRTDR